MGAEAGFHPGPFRKRHGRQGFEPGPAFDRDEAIRSAETLAESEEAFAPANSRGETLVASGDVHLGEAGVHINKHAPPWQIVLRAPVPKWDGAHDEQVRPCASGPQPFE